MQRPGRISPPGYHHWYSAEKKGYSGTAVFTRWNRSPCATASEEEHSHEGRAITLEFKQFFLVNVYTPNSQNELARLPYRMQWEDDLRAYLCALDTEKPVVYCGDLNVAHREIDLKNPKQNIHSAGFSYEERQKMTDLLMSGFVDTFRALYPDAAGRYTWWSYFRRARETNAGWRIDYFIVSERLREKIGDALIYSDVYGSDHCPVGLVLDV
ncbi:MAG: exodeoxyribonuclease III [Ruthenibacterium lactatiformans]